MRTIEFSSRFRRDFKRIKAGRHGHTLQSDLQQILERLAADQLLERKHADHALSGEWDDHRDCHVHPDLILIYRKSRAGPPCSGPARLT